MNKVAVFGNAGGGKSSLSKQLSEITGLPLHILDKIQFQPGGIAIPHADYQRIHQSILETDQWIIDGFGSMDTLWVRLNAADTLIFIDLPLARHVWWVTKRLLTGYVQPPEGWPEQSPLIQSSMSSYRVLWLCHTRLTPRYRAYVEQARSSKRVHHLQSKRQISQFLDAIADEFGAETSA
ncbi:MAG: adenylate kinase [Synechococcales cyanobacterium C42_A2020_086]|jgi:adenylate kinase family enzyme|nr:adenylate kinase [Synechococcales cyanobacterium M58_A2018_015]MBF2075030.1 adenylate kinase [Synechococcales cyanobacterium C42_A2020_086]